MTLFNSLFLKSYDYKVPFAVMPILSEYLYYKPLAPFRVVFYCQKIQ